MWFDEPTAGLIGGIAGGAMGLCGGIAGTIGGIFAPKGKFKKFMLSFVTVLAVFSAISLCVGLYALLIAGQPYHVWYPFVLIGGQGVILGTVGLFFVKNRYKQAESKKQKRE